MTNQDLLNYHNEISQWQNNKSILVQFNRSRIKEFYRYNGDKINTLQKKLIKIFKDHFEYEKINENEQIKFIGEGKERKPVYLEGKTEEGFNAERNELMNTLIAVNFC